MEWFQAALDRYKAQQPQSRPTARIGRLPPAPAVPDQIVYTHTRSLEIPAAVLREKRIVEGFDSGPFVDAIKILRTQVTHRVREKGWNVIGVTSPGNFEGKTLTAVNLAVSMAMDVTQSVLLVDANLQRPTIHDMFDLGPCRGLADYLLDDVPIEKLLVHPGIGRFVLLPGGRSVPHSVEALTSPKMIALVDEFKHRYPSRMIMIDLPPLLHTSDVLAFAPYVDALLLVVEEGRTQTEDLERALSLVKDSTPVLGTVLNKSGRTKISPSNMRKLL
jgi:protein-tyrosine kinase